MHSTLFPLRRRSSVRHFKVLTNNLNKRFLLSIKTGSVFIYECIEDSFEALADEK